MLSHIYSQPYIGPRKNMQMAGMRISSEELREYNQHQLKKNRSHWSKILVSETSSPVGNTTVLIQCTWVAARHLSWCYIMISLGNRNNRSPTWPGSKRIKTLRFL